MFDKNHPTKKRMIKAREKDIQALELRKAGGSYRQIAKTLGISPQGALNCVKHALAELTQRIHENAEQLREIEAGRLDALQVALWPKATAGDPDAVAKVLRVCESRRKLYGLDAPIPVDLGLAASTGAQVHFYWPDNGRGPVPEK